MAVATLASISAALSLVYPNSTRNQINRKSVMPHIIPVVIGSGKSLNGTVKFTGAANAAASADGVARSSSDADQEVEVAWSQSWSQYDKVASVSDLSQAAVASSLNPNSAGAQAGDQLRGNVADQSVRLMMGVADDIYGGDPGATPAELAGADLAIDSSGIFQGINPGTYTEWASVENTQALADVSLDTIRSNLLTPIYDACSMMPDVLTAKSAVYDKIRGLFNGKEKVLHEIVTAQGVIVLQAGAQAIEVDGIALVRDPDATANTLYAWNTGEVELQQLLPPELAALFLSDRPRAAVLDFLRMVNDDPKLLIPDKLMDGIMARGTTLQPCVKMLGARGLSTEAVVYLHAQLAWKRRNAFGKLHFT